MSESTAEFADTPDGQVAKSLHAALRMIDRLRGELDERDEVILELKIAVLMRQAMLDAIRTELSP